MGPAHHRTSRLGPYVLHRHRHAQAVEACHDLGVAITPGALHVLQALLQMAVLGLDAVPQDVHGTGLEFGGDLQAAEERRAQPARLFAGLRKTRHRVVVREGEVGDACLPRRAHQLAGAEGPVRARGVGVEIDHR